METLAVLLKAPGDLGLQRVEIEEPTDADVVVDVLWSGISTGTERLLYTGRMPPFPGMGYPLVPGYETVGRVTATGTKSGHAIGDHVFIPGARCFKNVHALFGGAAQKLVVPANRAVKVPANLGQNSALLALAATAHHAIAGGPPPQMIVGHGILGRLIARIVVALGHPAPVVWELNEARMGGAVGYTVIHPEAESKGKTYETICDASGDADILDTLIARLAPGGEITLAGFYSDRLSFAFASAFMREARLRVAAQWFPADLVAVTSLVAQSSLSLEGLITNSQPAAQAEHAYRTAFGDPECLKMVLDWRELAS
ncbi:MAG: chlorophyll synthesis pathway protein BchC [Alphaproteobacteria bacterium]|nr:chlorophyll synthesis pathway protein BchC [Alphaproteobacteria bacterium]